MVNMQFSIHLQVSNCFWQSRVVFWVVSYHCFLLIVIFLQLLSLSSFWYYHQLSLGNPALPRFLHQLQLFLNKSSIKRLFSKEKKVECSRGWGLPGDKSFDLFSASTLSWVAKHLVVFFQYQLFGSWAVRFMQQEKQERAKEEQSNKEQCPPLQNNVGK